MQRVSDLKSMAAEAKVLQGAFSGVRMQPIGEDALFGGAKLSCSCHYSTTVNPNGYLKSGGVFLGETFRRQLGSSIKGDGSLNAEFLCNSSPTDFIGPRPRRVEYESRRFRLQGQLRQSRN